MIALLLAAACGSGEGRAEQPVETPPVERPPADDVDDARLCTADALVVDGRSYGRDPSQNCQFVDENGNVIPEP